VKAHRLLFSVLLVLAVVAGTMTDRPRVDPPITLGGYRVLAADFHTHSSMWSDGALTPWGLVLEAERQGLDAIAITGHNEVFDGQLGRRFSGLVGGPTVLPGEEILAEGIAAHPYRDFWAGYDDLAMQRLDAAEICHPGVYSDESGQRDLEQFAARAPVAAIGSSDFHGLGAMGLCRTYVFATDTSERAILDAVRAHRTVVFGKDGHV
jgi:hypothetical protein